MGLFGLGKKRTTEQKAISILQADLKATRSDFRISEERNERLRKVNDSLTNDIQSLEAKIKDLEATIEVLKPVKGKVTTLEKAILKQIAAFEEQASGKSDSEKMYGAFTVKGKSGRPILVEVHTVKEAREVIAKVKSGKLTLLSL